MELKLILSYLLKVRERERERDREKRERERDKKDREREGSRSRREKDWEQETPGRRSRDELDTPAEVHHRYEPLTSLRVVEDSRDSTGILGNSCKSLEIIGNR